MCFLLGIFVFYVLLPFLCTYGDIRIDFNLISKMIRLSCRRDEYSDSPCNLASIRALDINFLFSSLSKELYYQLEEQNTQCFKMAFRGSRPCYAIYNLLMAYRCILV